MRAFVVFAFIFSFHQVTCGQELFTYSEAASNMPQKSFAVRTNNFLMRQTGTGNYMFSTAPEFMIGLSPKWMLHAEGFFGNSNQNFSFDGASLYAKCRFYSADEVHSHFRLAATGKIAASNNAIVQEATELGLRNTGIEAGLVATKLISRTALSAGASHITVFGKRNSNVAHEGPAINFNLSGGTLVLPAEYKDYDQVNLNLMAEFLGQYQPATGRAFIDFAPSVQFIFFSSVRVDLGYRFPFAGALTRINDRGFLLRAEYNFFSVFK